MGRVEASGVTEGVGEGAIPLAMGVILGVGV